MNPRRIAYAPHYITIGHNQIQTKTYVTQTLAAHALAYSDYSTEFRMFPKL